MINPCIANRILIEVCWIDFAHKCPAASVPWAPYKVKYAMSCPYSSSNKSMSISLATFGNVIAKIYADNFVVTEQLIGMPYL